jgi:hypothetical protein
MQVLLAGNGVAGRLDLNRTTPGERAAEQARSPLRRGLSWQRAHRRRKAAATRFLW